MVKFMEELGEAFTDLIDDVCSSNMMGGSKKVLDTDQRCTAALVVIAILIVIITGLGIWKLYTTFF